MARKQYPKRNAVPSNIRPKYVGRKLFRTGDTKIKCVDCTYYASHELLVREPANPFAAEKLVPTPVCPRHGRRRIAEGGAERIRAYPEFLSWERQVADWEAHQRAGVQESLV